jgi:FAD/FMN-containing dehydrogenase
MINRDLYLGALQLTNWESSGQTLLDCDLNSPREAPCTQGRIPVYAVLAESAEEIQTAVRFARDQNLRVVIRNTGHNALGQSSAPGSLQINTSRLKRIEPVSDFIPQGTGASVGQAATLGAGVLALEVAQVGLDHGFTAVMGLCNTVGTAGGFIQGGGVGLLGPLYGMGSDTAVEFNVVTAEVSYFCPLANVNSPVFCYGTELSKLTG